MEGVLQMMQLAKSSAHLAVCLTAIIGMSAAISAQQVDIIPLGSTWDYLYSSIDDGTGALLPADPFTANNVDFSNWTDVGFQTTTLTFDDGRSAPWGSGPALFGYGDTNVTYATPLPQPAANNRNITLYFRHEFTASREFKNLTLALNVDDGAVVHLDGNPVSSMMSCCRDASNRDYDVSDPSDPRFGQLPGYRDRSTVTNGPPPGSAEGTIYREIIPGTLSPGPHVLSVEVHQASTNSSDMRFDFRFFENVDNEWAGDPENNSGSFSGTWLDENHWAAETVPNSAGATATFAQLATRGTTVYSNSDVTMGTLEFDNSNRYAIAGHGTFNFATTDGSNAVIDVAQGDHEIQAKVALLNSVDITTAANSSFEFNNDVNGNGNSINISGDGEARVNGSMIDVTVNTAAGAMSGSGSIGGDLINQGAVLSPGNDVGVMSVLGNFRQGLEGVLAIDLAGSNDYDLLDIQGSAEFGGTLQVSLVSDFEPSLGDEFDILNFSSASGSFDTMSLPGLSAGLEWEMSNLYMDGSLAVVPEPAGLLLLLCGSFAAFGLIRRSGKSGRRLSPLVAPLVLLAALVSSFGGGSLQAASPTPDNDIIPFGSNWTYLHPMNLNRDPFNNLEGVDFDFEWFQPNYNEADLTVDDGGPVTLSWEGPAPSPIGFGAINAFNPDGFATDIGTPADGERYTVYLRSERFSRSGAPASGPFVLEFVADDGIAMYLNGEEVDLDVDDPDQKRYNCCQDIGDQPIPQDFPPTYLDRSLAVGGENDFIQRRLGDFSLNSTNNLLAVSLHNQGTGSSDLGFEMRLFVPGNGRTWDENVSGPWNNDTNWDFGVPSSRQQFAVFGDVITQPRTIWTDVAQSLDGIQFENDDPYNIAGTGSVNLQGNNRNASLNVLSGDGSSAGEHQFQVRVNLNNNTDALIEDGSSISFNNRLNLNGRTLDKTGPGDLLVRNNDNTGDGTINVNEGALGGGGTVSGNVNVSGGSIAPSGTVSPSSFSNKLTVSGNANVTAGGATLTVFGDGDGDAISGGGSGTLTFGAGTNIEIVAAAGYTPGDGDSFQAFVDWANINASGATITQGWSLVDGTLTFGTIMPGIDCDFTGDMACDTADIDMLTAEIATGGNNLALDIDGDGAITIADRDDWLSKAATENGKVPPYLLGDANLDGAVNASDLNEMGQRWTQMDNAWSHGDFTADGVINAADLNELGQRWTQMIPDAAASASAVPEPSGMSLLLLAALGLLGRGRRRN